LNREEKRKRSRRGRLRKVSDIRQQGSDQTMFDSTAAKGKFQGGFAQGGDRTISETSTRIAVRRKEATAQGIGQKSIFHRGKGILSGRGGEDLVRKV